MMLSEKKSVPKGTRSHHGSDDLQGIGASPNKHFGKPSMRVVFQKMAV